MAEKLMNVPLIFPKIQNFSPKLYEYRLKFKPIKDHYYFYHLPNCLRGQNEDVEQTCLEQDTAVFLHLLWGFVENQPN